MHTLISKDTLIAIKGDRKRKVGYHRTFVLNFSYFIQLKKTYYAIKRKNNQFSNSIMQACKFINSMTIKYIAKKNIIRIKLVDYKAYYLPLINRFSCDINLTYTLKLSSLAINVLNNLSQQLLVHSGNKRFPFIVQMDFRGRMYVKNYSNVESLKRQTLKLSISHKVPYLKFYNAKHLQILLDAFFTKKVIHRKNVTIKQVYACYNDIITSVDYQTITKNQHLVLKKVELFLTKKYKLLEKYVRPVFQISLDQASSSWQILALVTQHVKHGQLTGLFKAQQKVDFYTELCHSVIEIINKTVFINTTLRATLRFWQRRRRYNQIKTQLLI